jgi:hypothetical protein
VPHLVLKTVIKYKQPSLFPGPKKISENKVNVLRMTYRIWSPYTNVSKNFIFPEPQQLCESTLSRMAQLLSGVMHFT